MISTKCVLTAAHGIRHLNSSNNFNDYTINHYFYIKDIWFHPDFAQHESSYNSAYIADIAVIYVSDTIKSLNYSVLESPNSVQY